jgi:hypothetical protein
MTRSSGDIQVCNTVLAAADTVGCGSSSPYLAAEGVGGRSASRDCWGGFLRCGACRAVEAHRLAGLLRAVQQTAAGEGASSSVQSPANGALSGETLTYIPSAVLASVDSTAWHAVTWGMYELFISV